MSESDTSEGVEPPELSLDEVVEVKDSHFNSDNVAIVTGGGSGIGRATSIGLAENGLTAIATDIDKEGLSKTSKKAEELGVKGDVVTVEGNLAEDKDIEKIVEEASGYGKVRYLANIAGMQHIDSIEDFPMEKYDLMQKVMLRAPLYMSKLCIPHINNTDDGVGVIGNMCSIHGHITTEDKVAYNMTKFGLRGLTQSIAAEGNGKIRSFSVSTGYVKTPLVTNQIPDTAEERGISEKEVVEDVMLGESRVKEMMEPVDVANLFVFGFSKHAKHLNGGDLLFDGGTVLTY